MEKWAGIFFFADDYFGYDDAIYVAARLIQMLSKTDKTLSELKSVIPIYHSTPEIRLEAKSDEEKFKIDDSSVKLPLSDRTQRAFCWSFI